MHHVYFADHFLKQLKKYCKKFHHLSEDLTESLENFHPPAAVALGEKLYKVRIASQDLAKGKSGSFRCILFLAKLDQLIITVTLYLKSVQEDISQKEIKYHFARIVEEAEEKGILQ